MILYSWNFPDDGYFPNSVHPVTLRYRVISFRRLGEKEAQAKLEKRASARGWHVEWLDRIYKRPHYHSTTHEALVVFRGSALVRLGGSQRGDDMMVESGSVIVIPAGVGHQALSHSDDFLVFGCYPIGSKQWDVLKGRKNERVEALANIAQLAPPPKFI